MPITLRSALLVTVCISLLGRALPIHASTLFWNQPIGKASDWSAAANWGGAVPTANDTADVTNGGTVAITQAGAVASSLELGGGSVVNQSAGSLSVDSLHSYQGTFTYNLSGGLLTANTPYYSGTINQSGGKFEVPGVGLWIGGGASANYTLTDGVLEATSISVGATSGGASIMNMGSSAGASPVATATTKNGIEVGGGADGTLNMSGGTLSSSVGPLNLGSSATGVVNQTGGIISATGLIIGRSFNGFAFRTYNLDGGTLQIGFIQVGQFADPTKIRFNFGAGTLLASDNFTTDLPMTLTGDGGNANLDTAAFTVTLAGKLSGPGGFNKLGSSTLILSAANTYTGSTFVTDGVLQLDGALASSGLVTVQNGATLAGTGAAGQVTIESGAKIAPGDATGSIGTLTFHGNLSLNSGAMLEYDLSAPGVSDQISMSPYLLLLNGQQFSDFNFSHSAGFGPGTYTLIDAAAIVGGVGPDVTGTIGNYPAALSISGGDLVLTVVPEPCAATLGLSGFACLLAFARRRPSQQRAE